MNKWLSECYKRIHIHCFAVANCMYKTCSRGLSKFQLSPSSLVYNGSHSAFLNGFNWEVVELSENGVPALTCKNKYLSFTDEHFLQVILLYHAL